MHANQVLFEIVETWPEFACFCTAWSEAAVHAGLADVFTMNGLFMAIEVVDGCEADLAPRAAFFDASV